MECVKVDKDKLKQFKKESSEYKRKISELDAQIEQLKKKRRQLREPDSVLEVSKEIRLQPKEQLVLDDCLVSTANFLTNYKLGELCIYVISAAIHTKQETCDIFSGTIHSNIDTSEDLTFSLHQRGDGGWHACVYVFTVSRDNKRAFSIDTNKGFSWGEDRCGIPAEVATDFIKIMKANYDFRTTNVASEETRALCSDDPFVSATIAQIEEFQTEFIPDYLNALDRK